ncbi:SGNH/GDSL hydrolase family protein [Streptococcus uberis]|uniref:SGNH/GDSL hydrolase family protein n=1 Tax=Streptococcus uberis TaxID=1349 RepID=UPI0022B891FB|nr:GDSL-type esterase/lipase family protein [Streptococcus uberis]MCZ8466901.1 GDSL-type esterase/lipase family protein [Streptococcus uberis]
MKIHVTGDSLMARYETAKQPMVNLILHQKDPLLRVQNSAISGNTTRDLLVRYKDIILDKDSDYLFVLVGTNDLASDRDISPEEFEKNLKTLIDIFETRYAHQRIHFLLPPPVDEAKQVKRTNERIDQYGGIIKRVCEEKGCRSLNLNQAFRDAVTPEHSLEDILKGIKDDGLHFGQLGYQILAKTIYQALR